MAVPKIVRSSVGMQICWHSVVKRQRSRRSGNGRRKEADWIGQKQSERLIRQLDYRPTLLQFWGASDGFYAVRKRGSTDLKALKLQKGRLGCIVAVCLFVYAGWKKIRPKKTNKLILGSCGMNASIAYRLSRLVHLHGYPTDPSAILEPCNQ